MVQRTFQLTNTSISYDSCRLEVNDRIYKQLRDFNSREASLIKRPRRAIPYLPLAGGAVASGTLATIFSNPIGWIVAGVIVVAVTGYATWRFVQKVERLEGQVNAITDDLETERKFSKLVQEDLRRIENTSNKLSRDFNLFIKSYPVLNTAHTRIMYRIETMSFEITKGLNKLRSESRITADFLYQFNINLPCGSKCALDDMMVIDFEWQDWPSNGAGQLDLTLLVHSHNPDATVMVADPFVLLSENATTICQLHYTGINMVVHKNTSNPDDCNY